MLSVRSSKMTIVAVLAATLAAQAARADIQRATVYVDGMC